MPLIVDIKVVPSSGKQACKLDKNDGIVCYLTSSPERNMANKELVAYMAKRLKITQQEIAIIAGATSRRKRLKIDLSITIEELWAMLGIEKQMSLL